MKTAQTCPFYLGEPCSPKNKRDDFILCDECDGKGGLDGRSLAQIRREIKEYTKAGAKKADLKADKKNRSDNIASFHYPNPWMV